MRRWMIASIAALVLVPATANAQATDQPSATSGWVNFGVRGTGLKGDGARYQRYRDLRDGVFMDAFRVRSQTRGWFLDASGEHVLRDDQRLLGSFVRPGQLKVRFMFDQVPMLMSRSTQTLYTGLGTNGLFIPDLLQSQVQTSVGNIGSVVQNFASPFSLRSRRYISEAKVEYIATPELTFRATVRHTDRNGTIPYGGSFGHSQVAELPAPVSHSLNDVQGGAEWMRDRVLVRVGYNGSWFHNDFTTITFDNPYRATSASNVSAIGRASLPPSSTMFSVNGLVSVTMPHRTRASAYVSMGSLKDVGASIMPLTINPAITGILALPRNDVAGEGRTMAATLSLTSRPNRHFDVSLKFRTYEYDNRTPHFDMVQRSGYDNGPTSGPLAVLTTPYGTEPFGITRRNFDADVRTSPRAGLSAGVGYSMIDEDRTLRVIPDTREHVARGILDIMGNQWFTVRSKYEISRKRGAVDDHGLRVMAGCPPAPTACTDAVATVEHVDMRHFDMAERDRYRASVLGTIMPNDILSIGLTATKGRDDYLGSSFGLRDNTHWTYGANIDAMVNDQTTLGVSWGQERYRTLQRSRQANPGAQFLDPSRNWVAQGLDKVRAVRAFADFLQIRGRMDLSFVYDLNRATSDYNYLLGPVPQFSETFTVTSTLPAPTRLPLVVSQIHRGQADMLFSCTPRVGLGVSYWYERYDVQDFTLDSSAIPTLGLTNAVLMGYLYRPYTANTVFGRVVVKF